MLGKSWVRRCVCRGMYVCVCWARWYVLSLSEPFLLTKEILFLDPISQFYLHFLLVVVPFLVAEPWRPNNSCLLPALSGFDFRLHFPSKSWFQRSPYFFLNTSPVNTGLGRNKFGSEQPLFFSNLPKGEQITPLILCWQWFYRVYNVITNECYPLSLNVSYAFVCRWCSTFEAFHNCLSKTYQKGLPTQTQQSRRMSWCLKATTSSKFPFAVCLDFRQFPQNSSFSCWHSPKLPGQEKGYPEVLGWDLCEHQGDCDRVKSTFNFCGCVFF